MTSSLSKPAEFTKCIHLQHSPACSRYMIKAHQNHNNCCHHLFEIFRDALQLSVENKECQWDDRYNQMSNSKAFRVLNWASFLRNKVKIEYRSPEKEANERCRNNNSRVISECSEFLELWFTFTVEN